MIKKIFTGIIIGLLVISGLYLYFLYTGNASDMIQRMLWHILYTTIFFISIVLVYILQWGNKFFRFLIFIIILINLYILGDVFFRNNIGLDSRQFITLFTLLILALAVTYIGHRIRYFLMTVIGVGIVFVLLSWILPMYETIPNINDFIQSQKTKIINQWANEGILIIKNALGSKEIPVNELQASDIDLSQKIQISFASKTIKDMEKIFIDLGNGSFININPQSAVTLQQSWWTVVMQILQGNVKYYLPEELSGVLKIIGKYQGKNITELQNTIRWEVIKTFENKKKEFFINQLWGEIVLNPWVNKAIKFFINTLYNISPKTYQNNLTNYNNIQQYLGIATKSDSQKFTGENIKNIIDDIRSQAKKWAEETKINQWLNLWN